MISTNSKLSCVACRSQKQKCKDDCVFAKSLIDICQEEFEDIHTIYGIKNIENMLNDVPVNKHDDFIKSILFEARMRKNEPVYGSTKIVIDLENKVKTLKKRLHDSQRSLMEFDKFMLEQQRSSFGEKQTSPSFIFSDLVMGNGTGGGSFTSLLNAVKNATNMNSLNKLDPKIPRNESCRSQEQKCKDACIFPKHLTNIHPEEFDDMHKIYGVSNIEKMLANIPIDKHDDFIRSKLFEAQMRKKDPVYGSRSIVIDLENKVETLKKKLHNCQQNILGFEKFILEEQSPSFSGTQTSPWSIFSDPVMGNGARGVLFTRPLNAAIEANVPVMNSHGQLDLNVPSFTDILNAETNVANVNLLCQFDLDVPRNE